MILTGFVVFIFTMGIVAVTMKVRNIHSKYNFKIKLILKKRYSEMSAHLLEKLPQ